MNSWNGSFSDSSLLSERLSFVQSGEKKRNAIPWNHRRDMFLQCCQGFAAFCDSFQVSTMYSSFYTPSTAGCGLRNLQLERSEKHLETWKKRIQEHKEIWGHLDSVFRRETPAQNVAINQEWPRGNDLFKDSLSKKFGS